ncbi:DUF7263 family protein [Halobellus salinisoli]|uniref:DUF7263 family protein n=1 Tax=Halobellus salinisoli TaxID=3108500 RepID=UPI0030092B68
MNPLGLGSGESVNARAQANLVGFAVAILVVTTVTVAGGALANDALIDADRHPATAHAAERLAEHLVDADATHTRAENDLDQSAVSNLTAADLDEAVPPVRGRPIRVTLGGDVLVERGSADSDAGGESVVVERRVLVTRDVPRTEQVALDEARRVVVLDDHDGRLVIDVDSSGPHNVRTIIAGGRVVLHEPSGLDGRYAVAVPRQYPLRVAFESGGYGGGTATVDWTARNASAERVEVRVGG